MSLYATSQSWICHSSGFESDMLHLMNRQARGDRPSYSSAGGWPQFKVLDAYVASLRRARVHYEARCAAFGSARLSPSYLLLYIALRTPSELADALQLAAQGAEADAGAVAAVELLANGPSFADAPQDEQVPGAGYYQGELLSLFCCLPSCCSLNLTPLAQQHRDSNVPSPAGAALSKRRWSESHAPAGRISPAFYLGLLSFLLSLFAVSLSLRPDLYSNTFHTLLTATHPHSHITLKPTLTPAQRAALHLSPLVVGPRSLAPQYHDRGCSSTALLHALRKTHIRPDGASRKVNTTLPPTRLSLGDDFDFSFDLEGCPPLHLYSAAEACDLLQGFGGLFLRGDSFVRHVVNALFIVLRERNDGAVEREGERCRGNAMFDDRYVLS